MTSDSTSGWELAGMAALCAILLVGGIRMYRNVITMRRATTIQVDEAVTQTAATFSYENGVDITGHPVIPMPPPFEERAVVFLLRSSSLDHDLQFWSKVQQNLPEHSGIRLVAYCNDDACATRLNQQPSPPFPVIRYAEVRSGEALLEADSRGESVVRSEEWLVPKMTNWRDYKGSPQQFGRVIAHL